MAAVYILQGFLDHKKNEKGELPFST